MWLLINKKLIWLIICYDFEEDLRLIQISVYVISFRVLEDSLVEYKLLVYVGSYDLAAKITP